MNITFFKKRIFQYLFSFGLYHGLLLFFKIRRSKNHGIIEFKLPGLKHKTFLRRNSSDFFVFEEIFIAETYRLPSYPKNVRYIVDAGANIGLSTLYFLKKYPGATILSIEPELSNYQILKKNTAGYPNVICINKALWDKHRFLKIKNRNVSNWAFEIEETTRHQSDVEGVGISDLISEYNISEIDILKLDIEGSEKEIFESIDTWTSKVKNIVVEIHDDLRPGASHSVTAGTSAYNYRQLASGELNVFHYEQQAYSSDI